jgi:hypothetical protein
MANVSKVVERGVARCPRCVTVADYVFIESESGGMRYEVHCRRCGERYGERSVPWTPPPRTAAEQPIQWPRDREPTPTRDWRTDVRERIALSAQRSRAGIEILGLHTRTTVNRARAELRARRKRNTETYTGG